MYGTYFGGRAIDEPHGIDVDGAGNAYVVGSTGSDTTGGASAASPSPPDAYDQSYNGAGDIFLLRFNGAGGLTYATYLGGGSGDGNNATNVRASRTASNVVYVVGDSASASFPTTPSRVETYDGSGAPDAVLVRLDLALSGTAQLTYGTFLGGSGDEVFASLALDASDRVYAAGHTISSAATFPAAATVAGSIAPSGTDVLVAKFDTSLSGAASLVFATRINGFYTDVADDIALDSANQPWIAVQSGSFAPTPNPAQDFPLVNPLSTQRSGNGGHAAVVQLNAAGNSLLLSSLIGGHSGRLGPFAVAVTSNDEVWVGGTSGGGTSSLPLVTPFQSTFGGGDTDATLQRIGRQADLTITKTVDKPLPAVQRHPRRGADLHHRRQQRHRRYGAQRRDHRQPAVGGRLRIVRVDGRRRVRRIGNNRTITIPSLAQGATATITIATTVAPGVGPGQVWTNTATVTSGGATDPNPGNNTGNIGNGSPTLTNPSADADGDGLTNGFEQKFGLNGLNNSPGRGRQRRPGRRRQDQRAGAGRGHAPARLRDHLPRRRRDRCVLRHAPGARQSDRHAGRCVLTRFQKGDGTTVSDYRVIAPYSRATIDVETRGRPGGRRVLDASSSPTCQVVADRTMTLGRAAATAATPRRGIVARRPRRGTSPRARRIGGSTSST